MASNVSIQELEDFLVSGFQDTGVDEIFLNGCRRVFYQSRDGLFHSQSGWLRSDGELVRTLQHFAASRLVRLDPLLPAAGGDWSHPHFPGLSFRWHAMIPPASRGGPVFCMRRHRFEQVGLKDFADPKGVLPQVREGLRAGANIFFCGATGAGKTTLMTAFLLECCVRERIVILEALSEIPLLSDAWISLSPVPASIEGRGGYSFSRIFEESLRLRPDRIVLGEIRGEEALVLLKLMNVGHQGVLCTLHADSPDTVLGRLCQASGISEDIWRQSLDQRDCYLVFLERGAPPCITGGYHWNSQSGL